MHSLHSSKSVGWRSGTRASDCEGFSGDECQTHEPEQPKPGDET
jgi:hypothetical protein